MRSSVGLAALAWLLAVSTRADWREESQPMAQTPSFEEMTRMRIVYSVPGMGDAKVRRNLTYKTAGETPLPMDVYSPAGDVEASRPGAVVLVHGGPLPDAGVKDYGIFTSYGELLAASGLVAVTFNHRFSAAERLLDAASDVDAALEYVRAHGSELGLDPDRVAVWAFSGGGPFLSVTMRSAPAYVRAIVSYYAMLDLQVKPPNASAALTDEMRRDYSPLHHLTVQGSKLPPVFVARAGLDHPLLNAAMDRFVQEALAKNVTIEVMNQATGRHGFDILDADDRSREIVARTVEFLKARLR